MLPIGCCYASAERRAATRRSREIDRYLKMEKRRADSQLKILLLGSDESGKSAFWKQMQILYGERYDSEETRLQQRPVVYSIILRGMQEVIWRLKEFHIPFEHPENEQNCSVFKDWHDWHAGDGITADVWVSSYVEPLMSLWRDKGVQEAAEKAELYNLVSDMI